uniref:Uncharacterized protein n=1 Tax=Romanomermis culicivorax TaxID=13658 RepID=A0A915HFQ3_ROMCU
MTRGAVNVAPPSTFPLGIVGASGAPLIGADAGLTQRLYSWPCCSYQEPLSSLKNQPANEENNYSIDL